MSVRLLSVHWKLSKEFLKLYLLRKGKHTMKGLHVTDLLCCGLIDVHTEIFILNNSYETVVFGHLLDDSVRECYLKEIISFTWYDKNELCINLK